jgi:hypothetical protein
MQASDPRVSGRDPRPRAIDRAALATHSEGCIAWRVQGGMRAGATYDQIAETIGVAILMGVRPSACYSSQAVSALNDTTPHWSPLPSWGLWIDTSRLKDSRSKGLECRQANYVAAYAPYAAHQPRRTDPRLRAASWIDSPAGPAVQIRPT